MSPQQDEFSFKILKHTPTSTPGEMPRHFLADTIKEAEDIYQAFSAFLNLLAGSYAIRTGMEKADLFGAGLTGLGKAYKDWDGNRSKNFKDYAIFRIKDEMLEYIRKNRTTISVPSYVIKGKAVLEKLKRVCEANNVDFRDVLLDKVSVIDEKASREIRQIKFTLYGYAERAKVRSIFVFVSRIEDIPEEECFTDQSLEEVPSDEHERVEAALIVEQMKTHMDKEEQAICNGIMSDKSFEEIGKELGRSKAWVSNKVGALREKIREKMVDGVF